MNDWKTFRDKIFGERPDVKEEYDRLGPRYQIITDVLRLRELRGMTQLQLAEKMGKQQPAISRLEGGGVSPSLTFLQELASALDAKLTVRLEPCELVETPEPALPKRRSARPA